MQSIPESERAALRAQVEAEIRADLEAKVRADLREEAARLARDERKAIEKKVIDYERSFDADVAARRALGVRVFAELSRRQRFDKASEVLAERSFVFTNRIYREWRDRVLRRHCAKVTWTPADQRLRTKAFDRPDPPGWRPEPNPGLRGAIRDDDVPDILPFRESQGPYARPRFTDYERACVGFLSGPPCRDLLRFTRPGEPMTESVYWSVRYSVPHEPRPKFDFVMTPYPESVAELIEPGATVLNLVRVDWRGGVTDPEPETEQHKVYSMEEYLSWDGSPPVENGEELCEIVAPYPMMYPVTMITPGELEGAGDLYADARGDSFMATMHRSPFDDLEAKGRDSKYFRYAMERIRPRKLRDQDKPHRPGDLDRKPGAYAERPFQTLLEHYLARSGQPGFGEVMVHALERCIEMRDHGIAFDGKVYTTGRKVAQLLAAVDSRLPSAQKTYLAQLYPGPDATLLDRMIAGPAPDDPRARHEEVFGLAVAQVYANFKAGLANESSVQARKLYDDEQRQRRYESERAESRFNSADDRAMRSPHRLLEIQQNAFRGRFRFRFAEGERYVNRYTRRDATAYDTDSAYHMAHFVWFFVCFRGVNVLAVCEDKAAVDRFRDLIDWFNDVHVRRRSMGCVFIRTVDQVPLESSDDTEVFTSSFLDVRTVDQVRTAKFRHVLDSRGDFAVVFDGFSKFYGAGKASLTGKFLEHAVTKSVALMARAGREVTSTVLDGARKVQVPVKKSEWAASVLDIDEDFTDDVKIDAEDNSRIYRAARFLTPYYVNNVYRFLESRALAGTTVVTLDRSPLEFNRLALHLERGVVAVDHLGTSTFAPVMLHDPVHADDVYYSQRNMFLHRANNRAKGGLAEIRNWYADGHDSLVVLTRLDTAREVLAPVQATLSTGQRVMRRVRTHVCSESDYAAVRKLYPAKTDVQIVALSAEKSPGYVIPVFGDGKVEKTLGVPAPEPPAPFGPDDLGPAPEEKLDEEVIQVENIRLTEAGLEPVPLPELSDADKIRRGMFDQVHKLKETDLGTFEEETHQPSASVEAPSPRTEPPAENESSHPLTTSSDAPGKKHSTTYRQTSVVDRESIPGTPATDPKKSRKNANTLARAKARRRREKNHGTKHRGARGLGVFRTEPINGVATRLVEQRTPPPRKTPKTRSITSEVKPLEYFLDPSRILKTVKK